MKKINKKIIKRKNKKSKETGGLMGKFGIKAGEVWGLGDYSSK